MKIKVFIIILFSTSGCADKFLDVEEQQAAANRQTTISSSLQHQSEFASDLSNAYVSAARSASTVQDLASFVVILSVGSVVSGAVGGTSDTKLVERGLVGLSAEQFARRAAPKTAIEGIYTGAKRMNCISTTSSIGNFLLQEESPATTSAAKAATFGAINEVKITTREALVREVADYGALLGEFQDASPVPLGSLIRKENVNQEALDAYLKMLGRCLSSGSITNDTSSQGLSVNSSPFEPGSSNTVYVQDFNGAEAKSFDLEELDQDGEPILEEGDV